MAFVMRFEALAGYVQRSVKIPKGAYLRTFSLDTYNGLGDATWTLEPREALRFKTKQEAIETWRQPSRVYPLREDGKPNRPLTAFSVTIEKI